MPQTLVKQANFQPPDNNSNEIGPTNRQVQMTYGRPLPMCRQIVLIDLIAVVSPEDNSPDVVLDGHYYFSKKAYSDQLDDERLIDFSVI